MKQEEIHDYISQHSSGKVKVAIADTDGILRGKYMSTEKFLSALTTNFGFCNVVFGWDAADMAYDNISYTGWHSGYPDVPARIDINTFRKIPWEQDIPFFLCDLISDENHSNEICPRSLLKKVMTRAHSMGFKPKFSQEFEWFNFEETPASAHQKQYSGLKPLSPGMFGYSILRSSLRNDFFSAIFEQLKEFDIPLEGLHTETGPGVYEAAIAYSDVLEAADRATIFKTSVKEIGYKLGIMPTFMAKWNEHLPGCSGHVHQSLWNENETKNLFYASESNDQLSGIGKHYMAGQLYCLPYILPMLAPTINSYKRLVEGAWAPTTLTWAVDNRTVALRALPGSDKSCRLETRVVGSDVNPYLAMAACLASGLYGIQNKLLLQPPTSGNGYKDTSHGILPSNLWQATQNMKNSVIARDLFGDTFVDHFVHTREWEWRQHAKAVTDWERNRYFEII